MAIIVTEEKSKANLVRFLGWIGFFIAVVVAVYYIFFSAPELVIIAPSDNLSTIAPITQINIHPSDVTGSAAFQSLQSTVPPPTPSGPVAVGRPNPFVSP